MASDPRHAPGAPDEPPIESERTDRRESVTHDRQSHTVHRRAEDARPTRPRDPVTPSSDAAPNAKI